MSAHNGTPMRILHLGLGAFHRAHQAVYMQRLLDAGDKRWTLAGGNLRADGEDLIAALQRQGGQYTLETVTPAGQRRMERIRALRQVVAHEPLLARLVSLGADATTKIISFTVTEAGYYLDPAQRLDTAAGDLAGDLEGRSRCTIYGALAAMLALRRYLGHGPVTLLNCDNLRHNGDRVHAGLLEFLELRRDRALADWVRLNTTAPNAMVDRITPQPTDELRQRVRLQMHWDDEAPVMAEDFIQWVIEDRFAAQRPAWETVGVPLVTSVQPYEEAKIRILNATHSCIAWGACLIGLEYIHEGVRDEAIRAMAYDYVTDDVIPCLSPSPIDLHVYRDTVLSRFGSLDIRDTVQRVTADGFAKLPGFITPTIRERLQRGERFDSTARLPALFLAFLQRWHRGELPFAYRDHAMDPALAHAICEAADPVAALCNSRDLWGDLAGSVPLRLAVARAYGEVMVLLGVSPA